jgi:predicted RNA-binding protein YlxR (DUF448 family)
VHPDSGCIENAIRRRAFGRALRVEGLDTQNLNAAHLGSIENEG